MDHRPPPRIFTIEVVEQQLNWVFNFLDRAHTDVRAQQAILRALESDGTVYGKVAVLERIRTLGQHV